MPKIDFAIIDARLKKLRAAAAKLARFKKMSLEVFIGDTDNTDLAERNLEVAIEAMLDIGNHIIASLDYEKPENYFDIFIILGKNKVIAKEFAAKLAPLAGLRNRIIHDYTKIDYNLILKNIKERLSDFEEFSKQILVFIAPFVK